MLGNEYKYINTVYRIAKETKRQVCVLAKSIYTFSEMQLKGKNTVHLPT